MAAPARWSPAKRLPLAAIMAALPGGALAQQAVLRQFSISPQLRVAYDDNVLRLADDRPTPEGRHRGDRRLSPRVEINITRPIGRQSVFLVGSVGYDYYRYNRQLNRERINLVGGGAISAGSCTTNGQVNYSRRQSDLDDIVVSGLGRERNAETIWASNASISCGNAGGLSSSLSFAHDDIENSDPFRAYGNYHANTYNARIGLNRPSIGNLGIYTNYRRGVYDNRLLPNGDNDVVKSYAAGLRIDRQFGRIKGYISGGVSRVESNAPGVRSFRGGTYDVALTYLGPRGSVSVNFGRNIQQSNLLGVSYSVVDSFDLGATYRVSQRINLNGGARSLRRRLSRSPLTPVDIGNGRDRTNAYNIGASLNAMRHLSLDLDATWRNRRGAIPAFDYKARILAVTIRLH